MKRRHHHSSKSNIDGLEMARLMYGTGRNEHPGESEQGVLSKDFARILEATFNVNLMQEERSQHSENSGRHDIN